MYDYAASMMNITARSIVQNMTGLSINDFLSIDFMFPLMVIIATPLLARFIDTALFHIETKKKKKNHDYTRQRLMRSLTLAFVYILGLFVFILVVPPLRALSVGMFAGVGILSIVVGLAAQDSLSNLLAGVTLAMFRPFRLGDRLSIQDEDGTVEDITLRHTIIKTWDNKHVIIPNQIIGKEMVINHTIFDRRSLNYIDIEVSYDTDIDRVRGIMIDEVKKHPDFDNVTLTKEEKQKYPLVRLKALEASGMRMRVYFWSKDRVTGRGMYYELLESIKKRFDKEGIEIPYPHQTIVFKNSNPKTGNLSGNHSARPENDEDVLP